jgi:hypothetical protein
MKGHVIERDPLRAFFVEVCAAITLLPRIRSPGVAASMTRLKHLIGHARGVAQGVDEAVFDDGEVGVDCGNLELSDRLICAGLDEGDSISTLQGAFRPRRAARCSGRRPPTPESLAA